MKKIKTRCPSIYLWGFYIKVNAKEWSSFRDFCKQHKSLSKEDVQQRIQELK